MGPRLCNLKSSDFGQFEDKICPNRPEAPSNSALLFLIKMLEIIDAIISVRILPISIIQLRMTFRGVHSTDGKNPAVNVRKAIYGQK